METLERVELIPGLPCELGLQCLSRLPYTSRRLASAVCRHWRRLFCTSNFYHHRKKCGYTHHVACLVQSLPSSAVAAVDAAADGDRKQDGLSSPAAYGISVFDPASRTWERLDPVPKYPGGLPLFSRVCGSEGKLVVAGGLDPASYDPVTDVFVYDFTTGRWRQGKDMPSKRSFFAVVAVGGVVYVAGGHDEGKNALDSAWAYDVNRDEWSELTRMRRERDECEGAAVVDGGELWVVSGYGTESQGAFEGSAERYDRAAGEWRLVEGAWEEGRCPRSCAMENGRLVNRGEWDAVVRVGSSRVVLGSQSLVSGSEYEGGPQRFYTVERREGQNCKIERIEAPREEFSGFVQSACCVEI